MYVIFMHLLQQDLARSSIRYICYYLAMIWAYMVACDPDKRREEYVGKHDANFQGTGQHAQLFFALSNQELV